MNYQYSFNKFDLGIGRIRNKAKLDDGTIVEYDRCCISGTDPGFGPFLKTEYLGHGTIYEVGGTRQYEVPGHQVDYYDFWRVINHV